MVFICEVCHKQFKKSYKTKTCSTQCFSSYMHQTRKGKAPSHVVAGWNKGLKCGWSGKSHPNWTGGKYKHSAGYVCSYAPNHPFNKRNYVLEHRLVMEQHLGRLLNPREFVHHINGNKSDNRIENLKLVSKSDHTNIHLSHDSKGHFIPNK